MIVQLVLICFLSSINSLTCKQDFQKVKLAEIGNITLYRDQKTISRNPISQLSCNGSTLCKDFSPNVIQCFNKGTDGLDMKWNCKANLSEKVKLKNVQVNCQGFNDLNDNYVINGSCNLLYSLEKSPSDMDFDFVPVFFFAGFAFLIVLIVICCAIFNPKANDPYLNQIPLPSDYRNNYNNRQEYWNQGNPTQTDYCPQSQSRFQYEPNKNYTASSFSNTEFR